MFYKATSAGYQSPLKGVKMKTLTHGERTLFSEFRFEQGAVIPVHTHPHEQTGYVVKGAMRFTVNGEVIVTNAGDCWNIPGNVPHGAEALQESIVVEIFSPVREDYLPSRE
jgi:quercetin dioxygenase-like cupin family protein